MDTATIGAELSKAARQIQAAGVDAAPLAEPLLEAVTGFEVRYLGGDLRWHESWPLPQLEAAPRAIRLRIALAEGERIERVVALP